MSIAPTAPPTLDQIRAHFPGLKSPTVFLENAGGSQVPESVIDAVSNYYSNSYANFGAAYPESIAATKTFKSAHSFMNLFMNGVQVGDVILGSSTSALCRMLADAYLDILRPGDELIICETAHEANAGPWWRLQKYGMVVKTWKVSPETFVSDLQALRNLCSNRTRIIAFPHVSNILGKTVDISEISKIAHEYGAKVVVDGVAYASHSAIDVEEWDVDWYVFSNYKVYGPHMATLFGKTEAWAELTGPNHFFIPKDAFPAKFELGAASHEGCAAILGLQPYLSFLAGNDGVCDRNTITKAFDVMEACERPLIKVLLDFLNNIPDVRIIGPSRADAGRVGTVSFIHRSKSSRSIAEYVQSKGIGIRSGHMYAYRLCQALGIDLEDGVVRISLVHYNTDDEIERCCNVLSEVL